MNIPCLFDAHVHLREWHQMPHLAQGSAKWCDAVLAMPNLKDPLTTVPRTLEYRALVRRYMPGSLVAVYVEQGLTPGMVSEFADADCTVFKAYPGIYGGGVADYEVLYPAFERMRDAGCTLCLHGECGSRHMTAEGVFVSSVLTPLVRAVPGLRVVLEHVSTAAAVEAVKALDIRATITAHHLLTTVDDCLFHPRNCCRPIPKLNVDREALLLAVEDERFFLGSDSAPHPWGSKIAEDVCPGVYTAPYLPHYLMMSIDHSPSFDAFVSGRGRAFYGVQPPTKQLRVVRGRTDVPMFLGDLLPFMGGERLPWEVTDV